MPPSRLEFYRMIRKKKHKRMLLLGMLPIAIYVGSQISSSTYALFSDSELNENSMEAALIFPKELDRLEKQIVEATELTSQYKEEARGLLSDCFSSDDIGEAKEITNSISNNVKSINLEIKNVDEGVKELKRYLDIAKENLEAKEKKLKEQSQNKDLYSSSNEKDLLLAEKKFTIAKELFEKVDVLHTLMDQTREAARVNREIVVLYNAQANDHVSTLIAAEEERRRQEQLKKDKEEEERKRKEQEAKEKKKEKEKENEQLEGSEPNDETKNKESENEPIDDKNVKENTETEENEDNETTIIRD